MCARLKVLVHDVLGLTDKEASTKMGYSNTTTLWRVWQGETFPDAEKLYLLATNVGQAGTKPSLHWVITGEGEPLQNEEPGARSEQPARLRLKEHIQRMPLEKAQSLLSFLTD